MGKESKRIDKSNEKYINTHNTKFVCPYCNSFLIPWSWNSSKDRRIIEQYTCKCNGVSPAWYVSVFRKLFHKALIELSRDWSYQNRKQEGWSQPKKVPRIFNPSVR